MKKATKFWDYFRIPVIVEVSGGCKYYYKLNNKHIKRSYRAFKDEIIWVGIVMHIVGVRQG